MGWGSALAGVAQIAGGAIVSGMTFGAAAPLGAALISSGIGTIAGGIGSDAAQDAAAQQQQAAGQAQTLNTGLYQDARQTQHDAYARGQTALAPYQGLGTAAAGSLGTLMGYGPLPMPAPVAPLSAGSGMGGTGSGGAGTMPVGAIPRPIEPLDAAGSRDGARRAPVTQQQNAQIATTSAYQPNTLGTAAGLIRLRAPNGDEMAFHPSDPNVERALSMGAQRVA